jgi:uncharacterized phage infection (PIP) family protein YhgE
MSNISEFQQRVRDAGQRFGQLAEQDRQYGARLSSLLAQVEEGLARGRKEIDGLKGELTRIQAENEQLRAMLQNLLSALDEGGDLDAGPAMHELEGRIGRLTETASAINDSLRDKEGEANKQSGTPESPETVVPEPAESAATEPPPAEPEILDTARAEPGEPATASPDPDEPSDDDPPPLAADLVELPDGPQRALAEAPSDDDISTVNKIIQRISLLTGEFREADKKADAPPAPEAALEDESKTKEPTSQSR